MLVQCFIRFDSVAEFDPETGRLEMIDKRESAGHPSSVEPLCGHFEFLGDVLAVLYRFDGVLWLRLGHHRRVLADSSTPVTWERINASARLWMRDENDHEIEVRYLPGPHSGPPLAEDPTPFVEPEDWDFGLFVRNVIADDGRRHRIYRLDADD